MTAAGTPALHTEPRVRAAYSEGAGIYRVVPQAVALPASVEELALLVRWARETGTPLTARGAGSGIPGNAVGSGVLVDLRDRMPRRLELDAAGATAITSANITQQELNDAARSHGLRLPPDPSSSRWATLGGMVATNAAGARTVRYGPARAWVEGLEIVTADGEIGWLERGGKTTGRRDDGTLAAIRRFEREAAPPIRAAADLVRARFPKVRKNTAGYALDRWLDSGDELDLLIGSEGTLAFITTIRWRLAPIARARTGLRISLRSLDDLEDAVRALVALDPSAVELLDRTFLDLVGTAGGQLAAPPIAQSPNRPIAEAILLVEFERETDAAARGVVGDAVRAVGDLATDVETALTPEEEHRLWALRHAASPILASLPPGRRSLQVIEDGCVPLPRLGEYVRAIRDAAARQEIAVVIFGHAGDGNVHVNALPEVGRPDWLTRVGELYREVSDAAIRLGGTVSGEHGDGRLRAPLLEAQYGPEVMALMRRVKTAFDQDGILNPGVKLEAGLAPLAALKLGPDAVPIPDDIGRALREIERTGGYARSRMEVADTAGETGNRGNGAVEPV
ncbi:MAG: FAD-binding oxidoreductase [Gemmatimonadota bacterium]|nr:FAD-binding oxidoreductase [Gemmatimonadota bacterium]